MAARARKLVVDNEHGKLIVTRTRRAVRVTVVSLHPGESVAFVDLDDAKIDRLVQRLTALRGGKRALP